MTRDLPANIPWFTLLATGKAPVVGRSRKAKSLRRIVERISCSPVSVLFTISVALLFSSLPAYAAEEEARICGDYRYTPLPGYIVQEDPITPGSNWILLNMLPWQRTQADVDRPTIYCLTEENKEDFEYKLPGKKQILVRDLGKQEQRRKISLRTCDGIESGEVYFFSYHSTTRGDVTVYDIVAIEFNESGNIHDSIFVISPGSIDHDLKRTNIPEVREELYNRMCGRVRELVSTIKKR